MVLVADPVVTVIAVEIVKAVVTAVTTTLARSRHYRDCKKLDHTVDNDAVVEKR